MLRKHKERDIALARFAAGVRGTRFPVQQLRKTSMPMAV
jgi:hypothetical protein